MSELDLLSELPDETNVEQLRGALDNRIDDCWDRLDDVASELYAVHEVPLEQILFRVRRIAVAESADV
jgi:hypothetical protein